MPKVFTIRQVFSIRQVFARRQYFCVYFAAPIFLYIFLHFCLVCANNLNGADILEL
jgi:hypothetical protein